MTYHTSQPPVDHVPHLRGQAAYELAQAQARQVGRIAMETNSSLPAETTRPKAYGKPGDPAALRGVPVVGVVGGLGGHIRGTNPGR
jgi:hypothetical protein